MRSEDYLKDADIDYKLNAGVFSVNTEVKKVITVGGKHIYYDKLLIATGSNVFVPKVKGLERTRRGKVTPTNVFFLRTNKDQAAIKEAAATAKKVVIIGASFVGSECAASLKSQFKENIEIDVINSRNSPFENTLGEKVGEYLAAQHEKNGVRIHNNVRLQEVHSNSDGAIESVTLSDGRKIDADLVILGTGVTPATKCLEGSGIELNKDGGVLCDPFL